MAETGGLPSAKANTTLNQHRDPGLEIKSGSSDREPAVRQTNTSLDRTAVPVALSRTDQMAFHDGNQRAPATLPMTDSGASSVPLPLASVGPHLSSL